MCGIIGLVTPNLDSVAPLIYNGLTVLQHRGQDAAGIMTSDGDHLFQRKGNGLVRDVFYQRHMNQLVGNVGIGHVRYPTAGTSSSAEAQPFYTNSPYGIGLAHNGNLTNAADLSQQLYSENLRHVNTSSDSEVLLNVFAHEIQTRGRMNIGKDLFLNVEDVFQAVENVHRRVRGAYSVVGLITGYGLFAFRDPHGIRPLVLGTRHHEGSDEWVVASESVAITALGYKLVRDVEPGECVFISMDGKMFHQSTSLDTPYTPCIFEHVYFARPDSVIDGISVHSARLEMGRRLAEKIMRERPDHRIDVVISIPDSGRIAAIELSNVLGVPYREGFVKNRYIGRTFIMPGQELRRSSVRKKLNTLPDEFLSKTVLLVDDSIIRGNTSQEIVQMARDAGATSVYFASAAPPVLHPNVYGIDMPAADEYIAHTRTVDEICAEIGADWLIYQDFDDLVAACSSGHKGISHFEASCFTGEYVTGDVNTEYLEALELARSDKAKHGHPSDGDVLELHTQTVEEEPR